MSGRRLILWFGAFVAVFAAALVYFQFFAFYDRDQESDELVFGGTVIPVSNIDMIDAPTSPLKLRACFEADSSVFASMPIAEKPVPLTPPPWFGCFDAERITRDLEDGTAEAKLVAGENPEGFDVMAAVYPDGSVYLWRQLGEEFAE